MSKPIILKVHFCIVIVDCLCPYPCLSLPLVFFMSEQVTKYLRKIQNPNLLILHIMIPNSKIQWWLWFWMLLWIWPLHWPGLIKNKNNFASILELHFSLKSIWWFLILYFFCKIELAHGWELAICIFVMFLSNQCIYIYTYVYKVKILRIFPLMWCSGLGLGLSGKIACGWGGRKM